MKNFIEFIFIWFVLYIIGLIIFRRKSNDFDFMSKSHTNICRAVAALIIIFQHVAGGFGLRYFTPLGGIGVAMFLILSGYGLNESFKHKGIGGGYWKTKIVRVLIPYILVCFMVVLCDTLAGVDVYIHHYWYLDIMLLWYLVFYALIKVPNLYVNRNLVLGLASICVFVVGSILNNGLWAEQAVSFFMGVWMSDNYKKIKKKMTDIRVIIALLIIGVVLLGCKQISEIRALEDTAMWQGIQLVMKVSVAVAFIGATYRLRHVFNNQMIRIIGSISYELYLVHINILSFPSRGLVVEFVAISLLGAWLVHWMTESIGKKIVN